MGIRYFIFRFLYVIKSKLGLHKLKFPVNPEFKNLRTSSLERKFTIIFFNGKKIIGLDKNPNDDLKLNYNEIKIGVYQLFNKLKIQMGSDYDWVTNPIYQL